MNVWYPPLLLAQCPLALHWECWESVGVCENDTMPYHSALCHEDGKQANNLEAKYWPEPNKLACYEGWV